MADQKNLFVFGMGFSAGEIARKARLEFSSICGTCRTPEKTARLRNEGFEAELFDGKPTPEIVRRLKNTTHLLISISPGEHDPVLSAFPDLLTHAPGLQWICYLSTVGVYGNHDGAWVNEETGLKPVSKRSVERANAEKAWQAIADTANVPLGIFRLSGIYGPGRNIFTTIQKGKARRLVKKGQVFNRVHRDDIASAVCLAMKNNLGGIFNITDDEPAPPQDIVCFAHELMGIEPPPEIDFETAELTPMARSFYGENKRISNAKSKSLLGMEYQWPDYRTALKRMWDEGSWKS